MTGAVQHCGEHCAKIDGGGTNGVKSFATSQEERSDSAMYE